MLEQRMVHLVSPLEMLVAMGFLNSMVLEEDVELCECSNVERSCNDVDDVVDVDIFGGNAKEAEMVVV